MSLQVQAVVIGAGAVGLACARALALAGKEVIILERKQRLWSGNQCAKQRSHTCGYLLPNGFAQSAFVCARQTFVVCVLSVSWRGAQSLWQIDCGQH
jgi:flavin-dependent dehydrogenase